MNLVRLYIRIVFEDNVFKENIDVMPQGDTRGMFRCRLYDLKYNVVGHIGYLMRIEVQIRDNITALKVKFEVPRWRFLYLADINKYTQEHYEKDGKLF